MLETERLNALFISDGKATYGLEWFYNGSASRNEQGLEISVIIADLNAPGLCPYSQIS